MIDEHHAPIPVAAAHPADPGGSPTRCCAGSGPHLRLRRHLRFEHLTIDDGLSQNAGLALLQDRRGYLWIGTQDGLNRYDGYTITQFKHDPENPATLSHNGIIALHEDADGYLWIGTWGGGLNRFDPQSGQFTRYQPDPANPASLSHPIVTDISQDEQDALWIGTLGGLERFDPTSGEFTHFRHDPDDPASLSSDAISVIAPAGDGKLWVGTGGFSTPGAGLNLFDPESGTAQRFSANGACLASPTSPICCPPLTAACGSPTAATASPAAVSTTTTPPPACAHYDNAQTLDNQITDNIISATSSASWAWTIASRQ